MGKKLSEEVAVDSDDSMEDVSDTKPSAEAEESSSEESTSGPADASSSDSESSESEAETNIKSSQNTNTKRPTAAFRPPPGFTSKSRPSKKPSSSATSALSNLDGKQIFHIAAPSFLPLSQIREVALDKALLGEPVLSHKGVDYGLPADGQPQTTAAELQTLLVYDESKGVYVKKEVQNIQSYTVQEMVRLPQNNSNKNHEAPAAAQKPARPQPKHLKMRFHPVGSGNNLGAETIGSSSESEADEPTFSVPRQEPKRKSDSQDDQGEKKKKKKKEKHASSSQDGQSEKKASKNRDETSQEQRARKEKKKRKAEK